MNLDVNALIAQRIAAADHLVDDLVFREAMGPAALARMVETGIQGIADRAFEMLREVDRRDRDPFRFGTGHEPHFDRGIRKQRPAKVNGQRFQPARLGNNGHRGRPGPRLAGSVVGRPCRRRPCRRRRLLSDRPGPDRRQAAWASAPPAGWSVPAAFGLASAPKTTTGARNSGKLNSNGRNKCLIGLFSNSDEFRNCLVVHIILYCTLVPLALRPKSVIQ